MRQLFLYRKIKQPEQPIRITPVEKIYTEESTNKEVMILRPEGEFYRLYERSAVLFCKTERKFKHTKHFYKNIGQEVVSIGFPLESYQKHLGGRTASADPDGTVQGILQILLRQHLYR